MQVKVDELLWLVKKNKKFQNFFFFSTHFFFQNFCFQNVSFSIIFLWKALGPGKVLKKNVCEYLFVKKTRPANPRLRGPQISGRGRGPQIVTPVWNCKPHAYTIDVNTVYIYIDIAKSARVLHLESTSMNYH